MLQWFIRLAEFSEFLFHLGKTPISTFHDAGTPALDPFLNKCDDIFEKEKQKKNKNQPGASFWIGHPST